MKDRLGIPQCVMFVLVLGTAGCPKKNNPSVDQGSTLTPLATQILRNGASEEQLEKLAAEHAPTPGEQLDAAIFWSFLIEAELSNQPIEVALIDSQVIEALSRLTSTYPSLFRTPSQTGTSGALMTGLDDNFTCGQSCIPQLSVLAVAARTGGDDFYDRVIGTFKDDPSLVFSKKTVPLVKRLVEIVKTAGNITPSARDIIASENLIVQILNGVGAATMTAGAIAALGAAIVTSPALVLVAQTGAVVGAVALSMRMVLGASMAYQWRRNCQAFVAACTPETIDAGQDGQPEAGDATPSQPDGESALLCDRCLVKIRCTGETMDAASVIIDVDKQGRNYSGTGDGIDYTGEPITEMLSGTFDSSTGEIKGELVSTSTTRTRTDIYQHKLVSDEYFPVTTVSGSAGCLIEISISSAGPRDAGIDSPVADVAPEVHTDGADVPERVGGDATSCLPKTTKCFAPGECCDGLICNQALAWCTECSPTNGPCGINADCCAGLVCQKEPGRSFCTSR